MIFFWNWTATMNNSFTVFTILRWICYFSYFYHIYIVYFIIYSTNYWFIMLYTFVNIVQTTKNILCATCWLMCTKLCAMCTELHTMCTKLCAMCTPNESLCVPTVYSHLHMFTLCVFCENQRFWCHHAYLRHGRQWFRRGRTVGLPTMPGRVPWIGARRIDTTRANRQLSWQRTWSWRILLLDRW